MGARDAKGRKLEIIKMPMPDPVIITAEESAGIDVVEGSCPRECGNRRAASYVNFYIANGGVIVPHFGVPQDEIAADILRQQFPGREILPIPLGREIILGGGNVHCITQQVPAGKGLKFELPKP
eukprot:NODE_2537_length_586_cov_64.592179_g2165_i0.p1 GENE.NODE_2537_length_586_cov_64.592179_g2165_i0~~NODE_2537_length_586_cov_64.592179_g2165_i0.p1  ORF type:complete len:134 (+),score=39.07 NODE_2537_length_586_cov_64.592179_g2165_i0:32-403(+)